MDIRPAAVARPGDQREKKIVSLHAAHPWNPETEGF